MSLALAGALVKRRGFDPRTVAHSYLDWFQYTNCRGIGGTTKKALETFARDFDPETCGVIGSEGNGTAMRATPIGMYYCHRPLDEGMAVARRDAVLTHRSLEAEEGSAASRRTRRASSCVRPSAGLFATKKPRSSSWATSSVVTWHRDPTSVGSGNIGGRGIPKAGLTCAIGPSPTALGRRSEPLKKP